MIYNEFQERLQYVLSLGFSTVELADYIGVTNATVKAWSDGRTPHRDLQRPVLKLIHEYLTR